MTQMIVSRPLLCPLVARNCLAAILTLTALPALAQSDLPGAAGSSVPDVENSHRLLPTDTGTLTRLRERTELLRALGIAPADAGNSSRIRPQQSESKPPRLSPQLLELLQQMTPQSLPENAGTGRQPPDGLSRNPENETRQMERLSDLLSQDNLSPDDLRQIHELMRSLSEPAANGRSGATPRNSNAASPRSRLSSDGSSPSLNQMRNGESGSGNRLRTDQAQLPGGEIERADRSGRFPSGESGLNGRDAQSRHSARQNLLRRALGIAPEPEIPSSTRSERTGVPDTTSNQLPNSASNRPDQTERTGGGNPEYADDARRTGQREKSGIGFPSDVRRSPRSKGTAGGGSVFPDGTEAFPNSPINTGRVQRRNHPDEQRSASRVSPNERPAANDRSDDQTARTGALTDRSTRLAEISSSNQPVWQKLQRIAEVARQEASRHSSSPLSDSENRDESGFGLSNGLTSKLADVVQSAAAATMETVTELSAQESDTEWSVRRLPERQDTADRGVQGWAASVNDWIAQLPERSRSQPAGSGSTRLISSGNDNTSASAVWAALLLLLGGGTWWYLRRRISTVNPATEANAAMQQLRRNATERERLIHAFHELIRQSKCGSEDWWHHSRAVRQLTTKKPQLATELRSLAVIYEQARYASAPEPSPEQLAAAHAALKQCSKP